MSTYLNINEDGIKYEYWKELQINENGQEEYKYKSSIVGYDETNLQEKITIPDNFKPITKNLFDISKYKVAYQPTFEIVDGKITITTTWAHHIYYKITGLNPSTKYTFSCEGSGTLSIYYDDLSGNFNWFATKTQTMTAKEDGSLTIYFRNSYDVEKTFSVWDIMLEEGETKSAYEPFSFREVNLFDLDLFVTKNMGMLDAGYIFKNSDGNLEMKPDGTGSYYNFLDMKLPADRAYTISYDSAPNSKVGLILIREFDEDGNNICNTSSGIYNAYYKAYYYSFSNNKYTLSRSSSKTKHFMIGFAASGSDTTKNIIMKDIQLEEGSHRTKYEPYGVKAFTYTVEQIKENSFKNTKNLKEIYISNNITQIDMSAFEGSGITNIVMPENLQSVGDYLFKDCQNLVNINIPEGIKILSEGMFYNCKNLNNIVLPINLEALGVSSFEGCNDLVNINIPEKIVVIPDRCFKDTSLQTLVISDNISSIGNMAFSGCFFKNLIIPNSVVNIGEGAFSYCKNLEWIRFPKSLSILNAETFMECAALKVVVIPENIKSVKTKCFYNCFSLKKVIIEGEDLLTENDLEIFPLDNKDFKIYCNPQGIFKDNNNLKSYIVVWTKYDELYYYCDGKVDRVIFYDYNMLNKAVIVFNWALTNNGLLKQIDEDAFVGCFELEFIEINENVLIKAKTFEDCENLNEIFIRNENVEVEKLAFPLNNNFTIFTSSNSKIAKDIELQPYIYLLKENSVSHSSQLFLAGVGEVELFNGRDVVLTSKTLIDTGINLSVNLEDIQANGGAKLYGKYASQAGMTVRLTDAMFRMEFLAANLGETIELGGSAIFVENSIVENGTVKIDGEPMPLYFGSEDVVVWIGEQKNNSNFLLFHNENIQKGTGKDFGKTLINNIPFTNGAKVCVKYIKEYSEGQTLKVSANYLPDEMTAVLTASLFAGNQNNLEMATKVGTLTITIPRLILNGINEISMNMTGFSQMDIEGQALAVEESECDEGGYYAIISKVLKNSSWTADLAGIAIDNANHLKNGDILNVYGVFYGMGTRPLLSEQYIVLPSKYISSTGYITYEGKENLLLTVVLKDDSNKITYGIIEVE